ncbi:MAG: hypothetical protein AAFP78_11785 [Pseudomonadota bacterium]
MAEVLKDRAYEPPTSVEWPAEILKDPEYPVLEETNIDLACDAIVFRAPFDPNEI